MAKTTSLCGAILAATLTVLLSAFITAGSAEAAGSSVKCKDGKTVHVTTGGGGVCARNTSANTGKDVTINCSEDDKGNQAKGGCDAKGTAYCGDTGGTGDCDIKRTVATPGSLQPPKPSKGNVLSPTESIPQKSR